MRKWKRTLVTAVLMAAAMTIPAFAGSWQWIDTNRDGASECYYYDDNGTLATGTTIDGYTVNEQGAWVVDGTVQTKKAAPAVSTPSKVRENTIKTSQRDSFEYLLYTPKNAAPDMPLVVYLHGHGLGESLSDLKHDKFFTLLTNGAEQGEPAYIVAPVLPSEMDFGKMGMWPAMDPSIMELIEYLAQTYQIDRKKISIAGVSMGADAEIQIAAAHPELFSCMTGIIPFHYKCPIAKWENSWGETLKTVPAWFFVEDETSAVNMASAAVNDITAAGGQAWLEVMKNADHGHAYKQVSVYEAGGKYGIYNWMVSVSRPE